MVNPQLLAYIREQTAAGFGSADAASAAKAAGWSDDDIAAALAALESPTPWAAAAQVTTTEQYGSFAGPSTDEKGLVGLVIRLHLARDAQQANLVLIGVMLVAAAGTVWKLWSAFNA